MAVRPVRRAAAAATVLGLAFSAIAAYPWVADPKAWLTPGDVGGVRAPPAGSDPPSVLDPPSADSLRAIVERPLFVATRRPAPETVAVAPPKPVAGPRGSGIILGRYRVTGVVVTPAHRIVFLTRLSDKGSLALAQGERLEGWVIAVVSRTRVVLERDGRLEAVDFGD